VGVGGHGSLGPQVGEAGQAVVVAVAFPVLGGDAPGGAFVVLEFVEAGALVVLAQVEPDFDDQGAVGGELVFEARDAARQDDVSIVRIEQLFPFPGDPLAIRLARMTGLKEVVWCQEEPRNNGAWFFVNERIEDALTAAGRTGMRPTYAGRDAAASPATGLASRHKAQQAALVADALGL
jgi:hypothetical protein